MTVVTARLGLPKAEGSDSARDYLKGALANGGLHKALDVLDTFAAGARVYHSAAQLIANVTFTALAFNAERFDTDAVHDVATNNTRLTCKTAGKYLIGANVAFAPATGGALREAYLRLNGGNAIAYDRRPPQGAAGGGVFLNPHAVWDLAVNDYVEVFVYQDSGGALNVEAAGFYTPEFWMHRIG